MRKPLPITSKFFSIVITSRSRHSISGIRYFRQRSSLTLLIDDIEESPLHRDNKDDKQRAENEIIADPSQRERGVAKGRRGWIRLEGFRGRRVGPVWNAACARRGTTPLSQPFSPLSNPFAHPQLRVNLEEDRKKELSLSPSNLIYLFRSFRATLYFHSHPVASAFVTPSRLSSLWPFNAVEEKSEWWIDFDLNVRAESYWWGQVICGSEMKC